MDLIDTTCCFTGHRTTKLPWHNDENDGRCVSLTEDIYNSIANLYAAGYRSFICGMALGCDTYFARAVLRLKALHEDVTLEAAVPCRTQASHWTKAQQTEYTELLSQCDKVTVLQETYTKGCMMARNRYMVDHSSRLLACYNGIPGGTMKTILYARRAEIPVQIIDISEYNDTEVCADEE